tara:strand:+ start:1669 stop:2157 length:489 start_codon:yes stop_codon:yes gene_type:complete
MNIRNIFLITALAFFSLSGNSFSSDVEGLNSKVLEAANAGNIEDMEELLKKGADINAKNNINFTPLHMAVYNENLNMIKFLLNNGADVNSKDKSNQTPLHMAAYMNNFDIVALLLHNGANITIKNSRNKTAGDLTKKDAISDLIKKYTPGLNIKPAQKKKQK